jgi:hypothetical protein
MWLQYLPSFAAAASGLQFYAIPKGATSQLKPLTPVYDMTRLIDRACIVGSVVKLYQLLSLTNPLYPEYVLPAGQDLVYESPEGFTRKL